MRLGRQSVALTLAASGALVATAAAAQSANGGAGMVGAGASQASVDRFTRHRNISVQQRPRPGYEARGLRLGGLMAYPRLEIAAEQSDNLLATEAGQVSATLARIRPEVTLETDWSRHFTMASARATLHRHQSAEGEDRDDYAVEGSARLDLGRFSTLGFGGEVIDGFEPRTSPNAPVDAAHPIGLDTTAAYVAAGLSSGRVKLGVRGDLRSFDYADGIDSAGRVIEQDGRDRGVASLLARVDVAASPDAAVFLQITGNQRDYTHAARLRGPDRSSRGNEYLVGANFEFSALTRGEIAVGYLAQDFDDPAFADTGRVGGRVQFEYFVTQLTTISLSAGRTVEDAVTPGAGGYVVSTASLALDHELLRNLIFSARLTYAAEAYQGLDRDDRRLSARLGANYLLNRNLGLSLVASRLKLSSGGTARRRAFTVNCLTLSLVTQF